MGGSYSPTRLHNRKFLETAGFKSNKLKTYKSQTQPKSHLDLWGLYPNFRQSLILQGEGMQLWQRTCLSPSIFHMDSSGLSLPNSTFLGWSPVDWVVSTSKKRKLWSIFPGPWICLNYINRCFPYWDICKIMKKKCDSKMDLAYGKFSQKRK